MMSRTWSTNSGSLDRGNVSLPCGQPERSPDAPHRGLTQTGPGCQSAAAPMRCSFGSLSRVRRTARSTRSSPICRGAPGRISSPKPARPSAIKRFRHIPTVKPVVRSLAATAALFCPLAHSRTMRARKARDRELRGCCSSCRNVIFCSGLTTSSRCLGRPRGFDMTPDNPSSLFIQAIYDSAD